MFFVKKVGQNQTPLYKMKNVFCQESRTKSNSTLQIKNDFCQESRTKSNSTLQIKKMIFVKKIGQNQILLYKMKN